MQKLVRFVSVLGLICLLAILPEAQTQGRTAVGGDNALDPSESAFRFQKDDFAEFDSRHCDNAQPGAGECGGGTGRDGAMECIWHALVACAAGQPTAGARLDRRGGNGGTWLAA